MTRSRRFLFYTNECVGLGHLRRTVSLAEAVCQHDAAATSLIITGAPVAPEHRLPPGVDTVKLPQLGRDVDGAHRPHRLEVGLEVARSLRARLALAAAEGFEPDVAIVDKTPCGLGRELVPTLEALRRTSCRIVLGLRDVEDGPDGVRRHWDDAARDAVVRYYDAVLVYGPAWSPDALNALEWTDLPVPVHHVGYVGRPRASARARRRPGDYLLVTAGGGADGYRLLATTLEAIALRPLGVPSLLVTGPLMPEADVERLRRQAAGLDARVEVYRPDMDAVIAGARAVVSMAGYNTVAELLRARRPALLVPRDRPSEEQVVRARLVADGALAAVLPPDRLNPESMRRALDDLLAAPQPQLDESLYRGAQRAAVLLTELALRRPSHEQLEAVAG
jgi:predicted glycosyltransferase